MARFIDAVDASIDADERGYDFWCSDSDIDSVKKFLDEQPTVCVRPVVIGKWVPDGIGRVRCSACDNFGFDDMLFCPTCGANMRLDEKPKIIDATCAARSIWFQKQYPKTVFCDKRHGKFDKDFSKGHGGVKHIFINPDVLCDFTHLPFEDNSFYLAVFDPPHIPGLRESSWMRAAYGVLENGWEQVIHDGFWELMRVLRPNGVLIFKWSEVKIPVSKVVQVIGAEPLFGHRSGKKMGTHWMTFMKEDEQ